MTRSRRRGSGSSTRSPRWATNGWNSGPYGYLPTDPARLAEELGRRGLKVAAGTMHGHSGLHRAGDWPDIVRVTRQVAELTAAWARGTWSSSRCPATATTRRAPTSRTPSSTPTRGGRSIGATNELGKVVSRGVRRAAAVPPARRQPRGDAGQTERFLDETDPRYVSLCLDTGHLAYRHADNVAIIRGYPDRIGYVHIKQMDPAIVEVAERDGLAFGQAVGLGASCEPPRGEPDIESVTKALRELGTDLFVVVEQDMYPVDFDLPKPIAQRTYDYLRGLGIGRTDGTRR